MGPRRTLGVSISVCSFSTQGHIQSSSGLFEVTRWVSGRALPHWTLAMIANKDFNPWLSSTVTPTGNEYVFQLWRGVWVAVSFCVFAGRLSPRWPLQVAWFLGLQWGPFQGIDRKPGVAAGSEVHCHEAPQEGCPVHTGSVRHGSSPADPAAVRHKAFHSANWWKLCPFQNVPESQNNSYFPHDVRADLCPFKNTCGVKRWRERGPKVVHMPPR